MSIYSPFSTKKKGNFMILWINLASGEYMAKFMVNKQSEAM